MTLVKQLEYPPSPVSLWQRQHLDRSLTNPVDASEAIVGFNAQTGRGPSVGLWARIIGFQQADLDRELRRYSLVKANLMRGTIHMVTARQFLTWRKALQPALERTVGQFCRELIHTTDKQRLLREGRAVLADHDGLTRAEIGKALGTKFPHVDPKALGFAIRLLEPVVEVANRSSWQPQRPRYILASAVLPGEPAEPEEGLRDLLVCYLRRYGPVTAADASYFTGLTGLTEDIRRVAVRVEGVTPRSPTFHVAQESTGECPDAFLLPEYDSTFFAHKQGPLREVRRRLIPNPATRMLGSLYCQAKVVGSWTLDRNGNPMLTPWHKVPSPARAEFERLCRWYHCQGK